MKTKAFLLMMPLLVVLGLFPSSFLFAQCNSQATVYAYNPNIAYCASGTCPPVDLSINMGTNCNDIIAPFTMEALGGIELVSTNVPTRANNVFTIGVRAKAGNLCKGRLVLRYWLTTDPCNDGSSYPVVNTRYIDVNKSGLDAAVLNPLYEARTGLGAPARIVVESPPCITPSDIFLLSVLPVFEGCSTDNIGLDEIRWVAPTNSPPFVPITTAGDGSQITYQAPASNLAQSNVFSVFIGKAATTATATCTLRRAVQRTYIQAGTFPAGMFTSLNQGFQLPVATSCLPINRGGSLDNFTLTCLPDEGAGSGITYQWTVPFGYTTNSSLSSRSIVVTAKNRNTVNDLGQSNTFTCVTNSSDVLSCGGSVAQFIVTRGLTSVSYTPPAGSPEAYNSVSLTAGAPGAGPGTPTVNNCFIPGTTYTFALNRPPLNTTLNWSNTTVSTTASYWELVSRPNQWTINLRPVFINGDFDLPLSVRTASTNCTGEEIFYLPGGQTPGVAGTNLDFEVFADSASDDIKVRGRILPAVFSTGWPLTVGGPGCQTSDYHYTWEFLNGFGPGVNSTTACNTACFFSTSTGNGLNTVTVPNGIYSGTIRVTIRTRTSSAPVCDGANCFFRVVEQPYSNFHFRPGAGGGGGDPQARSAGNAQQSALLLSPNPALHKVRIDLQNMESGGLLTLYNSIHVPVRSVPGFQHGQELRLSGLPTGLYLVEYQDPKGNQNTSRLSVQ